MVIRVSRNAIVKALRVKEFYGAGGSRATERLFDKSGFCRPITKFLWTFSEFLYVCVHALIVGE
jgi:hypothetical protein